MVLPFSFESFKNILDRFQLPAATPSVLLERTTHCRMYRMGMSDSECQKLGFTIRLSSRGIFEVDVLASLLYDSKGTTVAFLHGCTSQQQEQVKRWLHDRAALSGHPLLLPVVLAEMKMQVLEQGERRLWNKLVFLEQRSGQIAAPAVYDPGEEASGTGVADFGKLAVGVLGITQLTPGLADHADALLLVIEEISQSMKHVSSITVPQEKNHIEQAGDILSEKLRFLAQRQRS